MPASADTVQVCHGIVDWVFTVTPYAALLETGVANVNVPSAFTERSSPPLFCSTSPEPARPVTVPPTLNDRVWQLTCTSVTSASPALLLPLVTEHICVGFDGWFFTTTA